jgi:uncharacterized membrane protein
MADQGTRDIGRVNAFTDGVLVVSMTLLILDLQLPDDIRDLTNRSVLDLVGRMWPKYFGYVLSFLVIANYWVVHSAKFARLRVINDGFVWLNIYFLLVVGFIPFATALISRTDGSAATQIYAATMVVASTLLTYLWWYAEKKNLFDVSEPRDARRRDALASLFVPGIFALSIVVAEFFPDEARFVWLLLFTRGFLLRRRQPSDPLSG